MRYSLVSFALVLALACGSATGPIGGNLAVRAAPPVLQLSNESPATVYTFSIEGGLAIRANWAPCSDPAHCGGLKPGETEEVRYAQIAGYAPGATHAIVYWWHLVPDGSTGFRPDSIRAVPVTL
jgi:hypothetical protein